MLKKSILPIIVLISLPIVYAQDQLTSLFSETIGLLFDIVGGITATIRYSLSSSPLYGKLFISIFMGIFFYSSLKEMDVFKKNTKLAGFIAVLIALITAFGLPDQVTMLLFSENTPFIGFVLCGFILLIAQSDSNWSYAARGIAFFALMISFSLIITLFPNWAQVIIAGFVVASLIAAIYNFTQLRTGAAREVIEELLHKPKEKEYTETGEPREKPREPEITKRKYKKPGYEKFDLSKHSLTKDFFVTGHVPGKKKQRKGLFGFFFPRETIIPESLKKVFFSDIKKETKLIDKELDRFEDTPEDNQKALKDIAMEFLSKSIGISSYFYDYLEYIKLKRDEINKLANYIQGDLRVFKENLFMNVNITGLKNYKNDLMELITSFNQYVGFLDGIQQKRIYSLGKLNDEYKKKDIIKGDFSGKANEIFSDMIREMNAVEETTELYLQIYNLFNSFMEKTKATIKST